jgi:hypothetical protein
MKELDAFLRLNGTVTISWNDDAKAYEIEALVGCLASQRVVIEEILEYDRTGTLPHTRERSRAELFVDELCESVKLLLRKVSDEGTQGHANADDGKGM